MASKIEDKTLTVEEKNEAIKRRKEVRKQKMIEYKNMHM